MLTKATVDRTCQTHIIVTNITAYVQKIVGKYNLSPSDLEGTATCLCCGAHEDACRHVEASCWICVCHVLVLLAYEDASCWICVHHVLVLLDVTS